MADLRVQINAIDVEWITPLVTRGRNIHCAVDLKQVGVLPAETTDRVAEVLGTVRASSTKIRLDPDLAPSL